MKIAIVSGGFDPIHGGHIELMKRAKKLADHLVVILNSDEFLEVKKGKPFMPYEDRLAVIESLRFVDMVVPSIDKDQTVKETLRKLSECRTILSKDIPYETLIFCNGGDRTSAENTAEHAVCEQLGIETVYGLGEKIQSSSSLISNSKKKRRTLKKKKK